MGASAAMHTIEAVARSMPSGHARRERLFFSGMAVAFAVVAFAGFGPSYYLKTLSDRPPLPWLVHLHGALFSAWILLLLVQTTLVAVKRTDLHRRLGIGGGVLAALTIPVSYPLAISAARRGAATDPAILPFLIVPIGGLIVFTVLIGGGFLLRRRVDYHKRLILIATIELMNAAVDRLPGVYAAGLAPFYPGTDVFLLALVIYDVLTFGRIHRATLWGGIFLVSMQSLRVLLMNTSAWLTIATWLTS
jgi:hypothetical protein